MKLSKGPCGSRGGKEGGPLLYGGRPAGLVDLLAGSDECSPARHLQERRGSLDSFFEPARQHTIGFRIVMT